MKVGDLIKDAYYGFGIILKFDLGFAGERGVTVYFFQPRDFHAKLGPWGKQWLLCPLNWAEVISKTS